MAWNRRDRRVEAAGAPKMPKHNTATMGQQEQDCESDWDEIVGRLLRKTPNSLTGSPTSHCQ